MKRYWLIFLIIFSLCNPSFAQAANNQNAEQAIHLLQYIAIDYPGAVSNGQIIDDGEYQEMQEFVARTHELAELLENQAPGVAALAQQLQLAITDKSAPNQVAQLATQLNQQLIQAFAIPVSPQQTPNLALGQSQYQTQCAMCHGKSGQGNGPLASTLTPPPTNFQDKELINKLSPYALYNTITQGVEGTAMVGFGDSLDDMTRWSLAFYVGQLYADQAAKQDGKKQLNNMSAIDYSLEQLASESITDATSTFGTNTANIIAHLRSNPQQLANQKTDYWLKTEQLLNNSLQAYRAGNTQQGYELAITAYLEGFEPLEPAIDAYSVSLRQSLEQTLMGLRADMKAGKNITVIERHYQQVIADLTAAKQQLNSGSIANSSLFLSALMILLREGLEIILLMAMIFTMVYQSERREALPYVHAGWISALLAGGATWLVSNYFFAIDGASRELTEAITGLFAAIILLSVGYWMHQQAVSQAWLERLKAALSQSLGKRSLITLSVLAFVAVYRELFEILLFFEVLFSQASGATASQAIVAGAGAALILLTALTYGIIKLGMRIPVQQFFKASSVIILLLAVMFIGHSIHAFAEVGYINPWPLPLPSFAAIGIYPDLIGLAVQSSILLAAGIMNWRAQTKS